MTKDLRYALRMLLRNPGFSLLAVLTFAVGIGVNAAVFSVVDGVLLRPLPYPDPDRITMVWLDNRRLGIKEDITSYPNYRDWRSQNTAYAHLAAMRPTSLSLTGDGEAERLDAALVTANFFDVMGVQPLMGRTFTEANEVPGRDAVVVLTHGLWQRRFGRRSDVVGRTISLNGAPHEIIGVMRPDLRWPEDAELWKPLAPTPGQRDARLSFWLPVIGRMKPGISVEQAQTEMSAISARLQQAYPGMRGYGAYVVPLKQQLVGGVQRGLIVLLAAVGLVLLIACVNLANLMLARTSARRKELAIRTALGAGRGRLVRQIVTEAMVFALAGGVAGVLLAYWATDFFVALGGDSIPRADTIGVDARVLLFAFAAATFSALVSAVVPAAHASRPAVEHLREGTRQGASVAHRGTRFALVAAETALALVLLTGAGLLIRTFWNMQHLDRGFDATGVATGTISLPPALYPDAQAVRAFHARFLDRVRVIPGIESAALTTGVLQPMLANSTVFEIEGRPLPPPEERVEYPYEFVWPGFFETLRMPIVRGRGFTTRDHADAPQAAIVNETLARHAWPGQDPVGRRLRPAGDDSQPWATVVGVIRDVHRVAPQRAIRPEVYVSALQITPRTLSVVARTGSNPSDIIPAIRRELSSLDPRLPFFEAGTVSGELAQSLNQPRFQATLLTAFAAIALLLAMIGIYGVTSQAVTQRTQEVGIRMALGARTGEVIRLVLTQHLQPALLGIAVGLIASVALSRYLETLLYGVRSWDPMTLGLVALLLLAVAAVACLIPARRAVRVDPLVALRSE
jgi:predicted permease